MQETNTQPSNENRLDEKFFERADAHIALANGHVNQQTHPDHVSNSFMYAASRFNAWLSALGFEDGETMRQKKQELLDYFVGQYKTMLEEHLDDYADNFDRYMGKDSK